MMKMHVRNMSRRQRIEFLKKSLPMNRKTLEYIQQHPTNRVQLFIAAREHMLDLKISWYPLGLFYMLLDIDWERRWRFGN